MSKAIIVIIIILLQPVCGLTQQFPDSIYSNKDSLLLAKFLAKDFKQYICKKAKVIFRDNDIENFKSFTLTSSGRVGIFKGFTLNYTDSFFIIIEVRGNVLFNDRSKPREWYLNKLKKKKIIIMEIPLHLLYRKD
jgi:hypothetical protein